MHNQNLLVYTDVSDVNAYTNILVFTDNVAVNA